MSKSASEVRVVGCELMPGADFGMITIRVPASLLDGRIIGPDPEFDRTLAEALLAAIPADSADRVEAPIDTKAAFDGACWSHGPRIGDEGRPVCFEPASHYPETQHTSHPDSGFTVTWGGPGMTVPKSDRFQFWTPGMPDIPL